MVNIVKTVYAAADVNITRKWLKTCLCRLADYTCMQQARQNFVDNGHV